MLFLHVHFVSMKQDLPQSRITDQPVGGRHYPVVVWTLLHGVLGHKERTRGHWPLNPFFKPTGHGHLEHMH